MSCSPPRFSCGRGLPPEITSTGARETCALAMPVMALVIPGPAVTSATPSSPVSSACACAMWTAARSSRTSMMRMPSASSRIQIGMMCPPHSANTRLTPRRFRRRAIRSAALSGRTFMVRLHWCRGLNQVGASQATSSETVKTAKTCEARIEPEVTPASRP